MTSILDQFPGFRCTLTADECSDFFVFFWTEGRSHPERFDFEDFAWAEEFAEALLQSEGDRYEIVGRRKVTTFFPLSQSQNATAL